MSPIVEITKYTQLHFFYFVHLGNKPKPSMTQNPNIDKLYAGESVSFECKIEHSSGWEYYWYKDGKELPVPNSMYSINDAKLSSNGMYKCMARRNKTMYYTEYSDGRLLTISGEPEKVTLCLHVVYYLQE